MLNFSARYDHLIIPEPNSGCHLWIGSTTSAGYGNLTSEGQSLYAHRCAYEERHGEGSADGIVVRHWCDMPPCVNADHLLGGTQVDNALDSVRRGRAYRAKGERAPTARLTAADVLAIRTRYDAGETVASIFLDYPQVSKWDTIAKAARRQTWRHL